MEKEQEIIENELTVKVNNLKGNVYTDGRSSSVEVSRNAKGDFAFKIKLYFNQYDDDNKEVIKKMKDIESMVKKEFKIA